jgi:hypothetical protein
MSDLKRYDTYADRAGELLVHECDEGDWYKVVDVRDEIEKLKALTKRALRCLEDCHDTFNIGTDADTDALFAELEKEASDE